MTARTLAGWMILLLSAGLCGELAVAITYPHVDGLIEDARTLRLSGRFGDAEAKLGRAQRIAPRSADVYLEYAYLRKDEGNYDDLKNVVEVGADVADGPPSSLAQLKILRKNLSALSLPVSPDQSFSTPPAIAQNPVDKRSTPGPELTSSDTQRDSNLASESDDKQGSELVKGRSEKTDSMDASRDRGGKERQVATIEQQQTPAEAPADLKPAELGNTPEPLVRQTTQKKIGRTEPGKKLDQQKLKKEALRAPSVAQIADAKGEKQAEVSTNEAAPVQVLDREERPQQIVLNSGDGGVLQPSDSSSVGPGFRSKTMFVGLGILGRAQSGTWMSRGPIETDY